MDIFELLTKDHELILSHLDQLEQIRLRKGGDGMRDRIFSHLSLELELHMNAEEAVFYPVLLEVPDIRSVLLSGEEEHRIAKLLLGELNDMPKDERWGARLAVMRSNLQRHIDRESGLIFLRAQEVLDADQRKALGVEMAEFKNAQKAAK